MQAIVKVLKALKRNEKALEKRSKQVESICNNMDAITNKLIAVNRVKMINNDMLALSEAFINRAASESEFRAAVMAYNALDEELQDILNETGISLKKALA